MMVEYHERKRFLDHVCPDFAHVVVIAVVEKVDSFGGFYARIGDLFANGGNRVVVAVAVRARNVGAVDVAGIFLLAQPLHKGLFCIDSREVLNYNLTGFLARHRHRTIVARLPAEVSRIR